MRQRWNNGNREQRLLFQEIVNPPEPQDPESKPATEPLPLETVKRSEESASKPDIAGEQERKEIPRALRTVLKKIGEKAPTFKRMLEGEFQNKSAEELKKDLHVTERARGLETALKNFESELKSAFDGMDQQNPSFEQAFAAVGRAFDHFIKPPEKTYKDDPAGFLEDMSQLALEGKIAQMERQTSGTGKQPQQSRMSRPGIAETFQKTFEKVEPSAAAYDTALQTELHDGKTFAQIREEYRKEPDKHAVSMMEQAIQRFGRLQNVLLSTVLWQYREGGFSPVPGLDVSLDPNDFDIVISLTREGLDFLRQNKTPMISTQALPDGTIELKQGTSTFLLRPQKATGFAQAPIYRAEIKRKA